MQDDRYTSVVLPSKWKVEPEISCETLFLHQLQLFRQQLSDDVWRSEALLILNMKTKHPSDVISQPKCSSSWSTYPGETMSRIRTARFQFTRSDLFDQPVKWSGTLAGLVKIDRLFLGFALDSPKLQNRIVISWSWIDQLSYR